MTDDVEEIKRDVHDLLVREYAEMTEGEFFPAMGRQELTEPLRLAPADMDEISTREWGFYQAGVVAGLEMAHDQIDEDSDDD